MRVNYSALAVGLLLLAAVIVGAYQLGQQSTGVADSATLVSPSAVTQAVTDAPGKPHASARFSHFSVGNRNVKSMYADGRYIWVGTSGGVIRYDTQTDDYRLFNNKSSALLSNGIFHVSKVNGQIVVGTYGGGMALYDEAADEWSTINIPQGLADQFVYDVLSASNGDVWVATWSGANRVRGGAFDDPAAWQTFTVENTQGGLPNPWVYGVEEGANGDIWFATEAGLARYRDGAWQNWMHEDGLGAPFEAVKDAIQFKNDPAKASRHHAQQKSEQGLEQVDVAYNPNYVISMVVDSRGYVWCGTWGAGLARFDGETWRNFTTADGLPANHIFMLYQGDDGQLWIGTNQGLSRLNEDGETFETLTMADGLYANNVFSMANGREKSLWVGSFGGVAHLQSVNRP